MKKKKQNKKKKKKQLSFTFCFITRPSIPKTGGGGPCYNKGSIDVKSVLSFEKFPLVAEL